MQETARLRKSVLKVCQMGQREGLMWRERYHAGEGNTVRPGGAYGYCEYPAILVRAVAGRPAVFPEWHIIRSRPSDPTKRFLP